MLFGAHISIAGGVINAPKNAAEIGCEILQMFTRSPQGGPAPRINKTTGKDFQKAMEIYHIERAYIHTPYYINLASNKISTRNASVRIIREELERGSILGCRAVMFHPGSAKYVGREEGIKLVVEGLNKILDGYKGTCQLLIEIAAGAGEVMGDTFEEISSFINRSKYGGDIGVCFDTQHAFASGYDLRTKNDVKKTFKKFNNLIGLDKLIMSHCNDSMVPFEARKDRHQNLGKGYIGLECFDTMIKMKSLKHVDLVLETPHKNNVVKKDLKILMNFRNK